MGEYRLPIRLLVGGVLMTGLGVAAFTGPDLQEVRNLGIVLLIAGLGAFATGAVLWPRPRKLPPEAESDGKAIDQKRE
jgi:hypothetical protein